MLDLFATRKNRSVRIFLSSTFRDFMEEREYLIKHIFPELRQFCRKRGVVVTEVDLRWGVTEEEAREGKVIEICLNEIDKSRPYFIGMLGERYGWVPDEAEYKKHAAVLESYPWVKEDIDQGLSITEMEIQYGVLRNPHMQKHAFFYLRESQLTPEGFIEPRNSRAAKLLQRLKDRLRRQDIFPVKTYHSIERLGQWVLEDLLEIIDQEFPEIIEISPRKKMRSEQAIFAREKMNLYLQNADYYSRLNSYMTLQSPPLVVVGKEGGGKSALLVNWINEYSRDHPETYILFHSVDVGGAHSDYRKILRRLILEIQDNFQLDIVIPEEDTKLSLCFQECLALANDRPWLLVIDGLEKLTDIDNAHLLNWLPVEYPSHVRVIYSTLPEEYESQLMAETGYEKLSIVPFGKEACRKFIKKYLHSYGKKLQEKDIERIIAEPEVSNPLVLKTLLNEIRIFGLHEELEDFIDSYLDKENFKDFFDQVLYRMEKDYNYWHKNMVQDSLSLLFLAKNGLSEKEILDILKMPPLHWSPFYSSLDDLLMNRDGMLSFANSYFAQAVAERYLTEFADINRYYTLLINYFEQDRFSFRSLQELPNALFGSGADEKLIEYLSYIEVFEYLYTSDRLELSQFWGELGIDFDMKKVYVNLGEELLGGDYSFQRKVCGLKKLGDFGFEYGYYQKTGEYYNKGLELRMEEWKNLDSDLVSAEEVGKNSLTLAEFYLKVEDVEQAGHFIQIAVEIFEYMYNHTGIELLDEFDQGEEDLLIQLANSYRLKGNIKLWRGLIDEAENYYVLAMQFYLDSRLKIEPISEKGKLYENLAHLSKMRDDLDSALDYYELAFSNIIQYYGGGHPEVLKIALKLSNYCSKIGAVELADEFAQHALQSALDNFGNYNLYSAKAYYNLALISLQTDRFESAWEYFVRSLEVLDMIQSDEWRMMIEICNHLAEIGLEDKEYTLVVSYSQRAIKLSVEFYGEYDIATGIALLYYGQGYFELPDRSLQEREAAIECVKEAQQIFDMSGMSDLKSNAHQWLLYARDTIDKLYD